MCIGFDPAVGRLRQVQGLVGGAGLVVVAKCASSPKPGELSAKGGGGAHTAGCSQDGGLPTHTASRLNRPHPTISEKIFTHSPPPVGENTLCDRETS